MSRQQLQQPCPRAQTRLKSTAVQLRYLLRHQVKQSTLVLHLRHRLMTQPGAAMHSDLTARAQNARRFPFLQQSASTLTYQDQHFFSKLLVPVQLDSLLWHRASALMRSQSLLLSMNRLLDLKWILLELIRRSR